MTGRLRLSRILIVICLFTGVFFTYVQFSGDGIVRGWPPNISRDVGKYLLNDAYELMVDILPSGFCYKKSFMLAMIVSSPRNQELRVAVRRIWTRGKTTVAKRVTYYFVIGRSRDSKIQERIKEESDLHGDIIQGSFIDSYNNLTLKSVFMLGLVSRHCEDAARFILKTDDDTYINVKLLVKDLKTFYTGINEIIGHVFYSPSKITNPWNKWYVPSYMYPNSSYPDFVSGAGYILSSDVVEKLFVAALSTPYLHFEDVFLTGICAKKINVTVTFSEKFLFSRGTDICKVRNYYATHSTKSLSPNQLLEIDTKLHDNQTMAQCDRESFSLLGWLLGIRLSWYRGVYWY